MLRLKMLSAILFSVFLTSACQHKEVKSNQVEAPHQEMITQVRQITFEGSRSGESYFSADGRKMIYQAEREPGNPFYQIYLKDLETGKTERVSTGQGKTTCSWIHPSGHKVMFSSTHTDPHRQEKAKQQYEVRKKGEREKYSWSYDEYFDIYEKDLNSGKLKAISPARGYDAEGSYSPDGQWIAFSSNRHAYSAKLTPQESKRLEEDPAYFLEIYLMRADGTGLKRLTNVPGYDGGPFFSPDGKSLIWRRFTTDGRTADVWTMKLDGSEQRQVTHMQAMSWAPYYHPSGDYLIFTTNKLGYDNFELYIVDQKGQHEPVRVTYRPGFDGLPVFSPDGKKLAWTVRNEKGESQIYMGDWDDQAARQSLGLQAQLLTPGLGKPALRQEDAKSWVNFLASSEMKGRRPGSPEEKVYSQAIAAQFSHLGLKPVAKEGFIQPFRYQSGVRLGAKNILRIEGLNSNRLQVNRDWAPLSFSASGEFPSSEIVFAGFGIVAPASEKIPGYDAFKDLDMKGRWALVLNDMPNNISNEQRFHLNLYARLQHKALVARQAGAIGLLVITPGLKTVQLHYEGGGSGLTSLPVLAIGAELAEELLKFTGKNLSAWQKQLADGAFGGATGGALLRGLQLASQVSIEPEYAEALNVVGELKVPGAKSTVMIGAHGDHLGFGELGNSLAKEQERGQVHLGADDNASGVAAVLELAQYLEQQVRLGRVKPKTNFTFAIWSAEELGVLGSNYFINQYKGSVRAYLNLDMVGRLREKLIVQGTGSAKQWANLLEPVINRSDVAITLQSDPYLPTDALSFYLNKIPSLSFFTGAHHEYHSPRDRADLINYPGLIQVAQVVADVAESLAKDTTPLSYEKVEGRTAPGEGRGFRLYLGTMPDYSQDGIKGVKISGTTKASPAEKAGLLEGDIIVQLGGTKIENIQDYVYCLQSMKANEKTAVKVLRRGLALDLEIVPVLKGM